MYKKLVKLRARTLVFLTHNMALPMLTVIRKPEVFPYSFSDLRRLPADSLGRQLADFLDARGLSLLPHYARHDIKHILLGYDTTDHGEVCLQCFMLGNRHVSFPVLATVLYGYCTMPEYWRLFKAAFRRGREAAQISDWPWFELLPKSLQALRAHID